ncbi:hypothetical protein Sme01_25230 [Sphaerisporangium melleum]|uniref:Uncharacterized protein n=1 Tax=Sphaerisporangium melleum TaxID=321316 RepID=A0A917QQY5_9ACTN|nr:Rv3235 family protein [Sphaerisporangium melleum]GGK64687.1 hypothetical protein GCM10007964_04700 [Sphaerisporangium melleum]GII70047.1 hypothetical protein Sme01_25230 [Sphaerisporangium melleum]
MSPSSSLSGKPSTAKPSRPARPSRPSAPTRRPLPTGPSRPAAPLPRLRPVPQTDPPYDDERGPGFVPPPAQGTLALTFDEVTVRPAGAPAPDQPAADVAPARPRDTSPPARQGDHGPAALPVRRRAAGPPPDERALRVLGQALAEILAGRRPPGTVADRLTDAAYTDLVRAGKMIHTTRPPRVALPHVNRPHDGAVEVCVLVHCGERSHVLALRMERRGVQWLVTDFETA